MRAIRAQHLVLSQRVVAMTRLSLMSWGKNDTKDSLRHRVGAGVLKLALRIMPVESLKAFHWHPDGYNGDKYRVVISSRRVNYWTDQDYEDGLQIYLVKHDEDGVLGAFLWWKDARKAASLLSQHYDDYHFQEHVLDEETDRIVLAEDRLDDLEPNLEVERVWAHRELDWDEWDESDRLINGDTVRSIDDVREQLGIDEPPAHASSEGNTAVEGDV